MKFDISNSSTYTEIVVESYVDYLVFDQMYKIHPILDLGSNGKGEVYNPASIASQYIYSHIKVVIFSALAIESEINLLGRLIFGRKLFDDALERNSTISKILLIDNKKGSMALKNGEEPLNMIRLLFSKRDEYVHDKSTRLSDERKSIDNGIWLCQNCAKLVDNDEQRYTSDLLLDWKKLSEQAALLEVENLSPPSEYSKVEDTELLRFYSQCFDRPAFQDSFRSEGSMEAFDRAITDTITAINTGALRARDGTILTQAKGKSYLSNPEWREKMDTIVDLLRAIRSRYLLAVQTGQIYLGSEYQGQQFYDIRDEQVAEWMDSTRAEIIQLFSDLCKEAGIPPLQFPRSLGRSEYSGPIYSTSPVLGNHLSG